MDRIRSQCTNLTESGRNHFVERGFLQQIRPLSQSTCTFPSENHENRSDSLAHGHIQKKIPGPTYVSPGIRKTAATYSPTWWGSTIGASELNFSVRNGKRWILTAITTAIYCLRENNFNTLLEHRALRGSLRFWLPSALNLDSCALSYSLSQRKISGN